MRGCLEHGIAAVSVCLGVCLCHGGEPAKPNPASIVRPADSVAPEPRDREEYLLTIEEVEGGSPKLARPQGAALRDSGWLETADGASHQLRVNKRIEVLISPVSPFHLKVNDRGEVVELNGRLRKSDPKIISHAREDFRIEVEYRTARPDGAKTGMNSSIPISLGRKWWMKGAIGSPDRIWSLEKRPRANDLPLIDKLQEISQKGNVSYDILWTSPHEHFLPLQLSELGANFIFQGAGHFGSHARAGQTRGRRDTVPHRPS